MRDPRPDGLSRRQLGWLLWGALLSPLTRTAPGALLAAAEGGAWLAAALCVPGGALLAVILGRYYALRRPGEGLGGLLCRGLGPGPGRVLTGIWGLWLAFGAGVALRSGADRFVASVYPESPVWLFAGATLLLGLLPGRGRVRTLGRCARTAAPWLAGMFALVLLLAAPDMDPSELALPDRALLRAGRGALPLLGVLSSGAFLLLLTDRADPGPPGGAFLAPLTGLAALALALTGAVTGVFGPTLAGQMDYSFFVLIRNVQLLHLMERMEALVAAMWVISDFLLLGALLQAAPAALGTALYGPGRPRPDWLFWLCAVLAGAAARFCAPDAFGLQALGRRTVPLVNLCFAFGALPLALLVGRLRRKW